MALMNLVAPLAAMLTATLVVWGIYSLVTAQGRALRERVAQYGGSGVVARSASPSTALLKDRSFSGIAAFDRLLTGRGYSDRVALDLARAAVPLRVGEYLLIRWMAAAFLFVMGVLLASSVLYGAPLALVGFYLPKLWVSRREKARVAKIEDQLVDALTMMSNALKAGSSFLQAIEMVSRELPAPIAQEFAQVVAEAGVGAPLDQSLHELAKRVRSYDVYLMTTAMTIQRTVGGNLAEVLANIAHTIRERQRLLRQVQVETAEQRFSAYILIALPIGVFILLTIINRPYMEVMFTTDSGHLMLAGSLVMQFIGYLLMRKIADVKV